MNTRHLLGPAMAAFVVAAMLQAADATETRLPAVQISHKNLKLKPGIEPGLKLAPLHLACKAAGAPEEFPTGIRLTNDGVRAIPAGTRIHWVMNWDVKHPPIRRQGDYTFASALAHGKSIGLASVMSGAGQGEPCTVTFVNSGETLKRANPKNLNLKAKPGLDPGILESISGTVRLADPTYGHPTGSNVCDRIRVTVSERHISTGGHIKLPVFQAVRTARASGNFRLTHSCRYFLTALPLNRKLYLGARYSGGWSKPGDIGVLSRPVGWKNPIVLTGRHKSRANANLELYTVVIQ